MIRSRKTHPATNQEMAVVMSVALFCHSVRKATAIGGYGACKIGYCRQDTAFFSMHPVNSMYVEMTKKQRVTRYAANCQESCRFPPTGRAGKAVLIALRELRVSTSSERDTLLITRPQLPVWVRYDGCRGKIRKGGRGSDERVGRQPSGDAVMRGSGVFYQIGAARQISDGQTNLKPKIFLPSPPLAITHDGLKRHPLPPSCNQPTAHTQCPRFLQAHSTQSLLRS